MRSLDAIQLAAALSIGDDPEGFVTYDARLARAARQEGLTVLHPGVKTLTA
jgi:predicted nucleic acid-binding protein